MATAARTFSLAWKSACIAALILAGLPLQRILVRLNSPARRRLPALFHRALLKLFRVRCKVSGPLPGGQLLLAGNHISWLDIIILSAARPASFVARADMADWPLFGLCARLQESVFIDRARRADAARAVDELAARFRAGDTIVLFPEGTTGNGFHLKPFRAPLLEAAAARPEVPLQPFAIRYTRRGGLPLGRSDMPAIAWYGDMEIWPHLKGLLAGPPVDAEIRFGEPLTREAGESRKHLAARLEEAVRELKR